MADQNLRIIVEKNPSQARLSELNIKCWPKWGCSPGKYQVKYEAEEICYIVKGKVKAYPKGADEEDTSQCVEFGAGDIVTFPMGLYCTWHVSLPVDKHYIFLHHPHPSSPSSSSS